MKLFKRVLATIMLLAAFTFAVPSTATAQSGWSTGNYYAYEGQSWTDWKNEFVGYNQWGQAVYQRYCRQTNWYREYRSGYYKTWNAQTGRWTSQWYEGYQWYCTWSAWYYC